MSCAKQKPLQPPRKGPSVLEPPPIIPSRSLQHFRTAAGEQQEKNIVSGVSLGRSGLLPFRVRIPRPGLFPFSLIRCSTRQGGHNFSYRSGFNSGRCLATKSATAKCFCAVRPVFSIEIPKSNVRNARLPAVRHSTRRAKNMRGLYV